MGTPFGLVGADYGSPGVGVEQRLDAGARACHAHVLAIDDDAGVITLFKRYLEQEGYQVVGITQSGAKPCCEFHGHQRIHAQAEEPGVGVELGVRRDHDAPLHR